MYTLNRECLVDCGFALILVLPVTGAAVFGEVVLVEAFDASAEQELAGVADTGDGQKDDSDEMQCVAQLVWIVHPAVSTPATFFLPDHARVVQNGSVYQGIGYESKHV